LALARAIRRKHRESFRSVDRAAVSQKCSAFKFGKHALDNWLQLWQVGGGGFP
jgi:hypothetical protein